MKYVEDWKKFNEESSFRNIMLSSLLSLGLNFAQAQEVHKDSIKVDIVRSIMDFNKAKTFDLKDDNTLKAELKSSLSKNLVDTDFFMEKYLRVQSDGTIVVSPNFIEGLELHMNKNELGLSYKFKF